ncbi:MAG: D-galactonate dehydratase, partial [Alphaproteobacteria bacterium]|nr:D-galactonate dehydratase [Alphaproteobacteria bacterium]
MKITKIETHKHWVDWCNWMFVRIETDEGLVGWGEASLHGALDSVEAAIREFAPHLIGQDPAGPERHGHRLYNAWRWRAGAVFSTALAGIDLALWDL